MFVVRPVTLGDLDQLLKLACGAGPGLTTLPREVQKLEQNIQNSLRAFGNDVGSPGDQYYFLVLEDIENKKIIGTSGIFAAVGQKQPFYNYRLLKTVSVSKEPPIRVETRLLSLTNDYTGATEIATLYINPENRVGGLGRLLSKCRFLLMAAYPNRFSEIVMAEIRGWVDEEGHSPFWNAVGANFFDMDFIEADFINSEGNNQFIGDVMPKFPIYANLLPEVAREVIGKPHETSAIALKMLEKEGFRYRGAVDIFDAGPCVESMRDNIKSVRNTISAVVAETPDQVDGETLIVANPNIVYFRVAYCPLKQIDGKPDRIAIPKDVADSLGVEAGMEVMYLPPMSDYR
jgi:arginine N-succinyltransferase